MLPVSPSSKNQPSSGQSLTVGALFSASLAVSATACWKPPTSPEALRAWCSDDAECIKACRQAADDREYNGWCNTLQRKATRARWAASGTRQGKSSGTCFAISGDGDLVTAEHVVSNATTIRAKFTDGRTEVAKVVSSTQSVDIATLKIEGSTPHYLPLSKPGSTRAGDQVFTVGFPVPDLLGVEAKFTDGVVSALSGWQNEATLMQITVPVQPGNSGGPLVNDRGEVIGIITSSAAPAFFARATGALPQGINWAVKVDYLTPLVSKAVPLPPTPSRVAALERVKKSVCMLEVTR